MKVVLLQHTPDPEATIALAARLCYSQVDIVALSKRLGPLEIKTFLDKIMSRGHQSVLEHASFTFGIEGISRVTSHQLVRHRVASYSQQSQRYVSHLERFEAVTPPSVTENPALASLFEASVSALHAAYASLIEGGVPAEDARYLLPNATTTKLLVTMNARELLHFFTLRLCYRAQWEIRAMSVEMLRLVRPVAPTVFAKGGPGCLAGPCPEGVACCGKMSEAREFFKEK
jgi:thymidylate synthase (FAD)